MTVSPPALSGVGVWSAELRFGKPDDIVELAAELESLGYTALWIPDIGGPVFEALDLLLDSTAAVTVATGILNIWPHSPPDVGAWWNQLPADRQARIMLGLGVSHAALIGEAWSKPIATMNAYLDGLDAEGVPASSRCLAALGPRMLDVSRRRSVGAHPYLVTPEYTAIAREALGEAKLYVEQGFVLETDPDLARAAARGALEHYCGLPNYANNWKRLGFTDDDIETRSDHLVDALVVWGDADAVRVRIDAHMQAGADHVCIQALAGSGTMTAREMLQALAPNSPAR